MSADTETLNTCRDPDVTDFAIVAVQASAKATQRIHHAVRVRMRRSAVARVVQVLEDTHVLVLEQDLVLIGVGAGRILGHRELLSDTCLASR